jgi:predicted nucleic acid-binding protein
MSMVVGFDANILVYTLETPGNAKLDRARDLVNRAAGSASTALLLQSLTEFSSVAVRKLRMDAELVIRRVAALRRVAEVHPPSGDDLMNALDLVRNHRIGFWDALLCSTARRTGIQYLLSEDMQDGRRFGSLTIVNPFMPENAALIDRILPP